MGTATRTLLRRTTATVGRRCLSVQGEEAMGRLRDALEQYRVKNYQQEIPSRFKKEMVKSAVSSRIPETATREEAAVEGIEELLQNIGVFGKQVSHDDVERIVTELNGEENANGELGADQILSKVL